MKIAVISPPWIPIPPPMYGGIELVVYNLVEGLTKLGEDVTLFAPKESKVSCKLVPYLESPKYFGLDSPVDMKEFVAELAGKYAYALGAYQGADIIHDHTLINSVVDVPSVHTLHGPAVESLVSRAVQLSKNRNNHFVSISYRQQELYKDVDDKINFAGTVHNSVDATKIEWTEKKEDFFLFVGRSNWEKGLDLAVRVASKAKVGLVMAVKMSEDFEKEFFEKEIRHWIDNFPKNLHFEFYEEISKNQLFNLYKRAKCTLFTSQWEEPFGLVMTESMASGTPVIALRRGAAPEVIADGKTGFVVDTEEEMIEATKKVDSLKPSDCRKHIEDNFSLEKMAKDYLEIYKKILSRT